MLCKCKFIYQLIIYAQISTGNWENDSKLMQKIIGQSPIFNLIKSRKKKSQNKSCCVVLNQDWAFRRERRRGLKELNKDKWELQEDPSAELFEP